MNYIKNLPVKKVFKVFTDFDGTITKTDVGDAVFRRFGNSEEVEKITINLLSAKISAKQSWIDLCNSVPLISSKELDEFIDTIEIDPTFSEFIDFCSKNNIEHFILSDGFDYYIERILKREKLSHLKYYSNHLTIENNRLIPSFPYLDINFEKTANCKRNHIINHSGDDEFTIFIGDGNSDKDTIRFCDFIFAKDDLMKYCEKERITYFPFNDFNDVSARIEKLMSKKRLKKRHQSELNRKHVYMAE
jgi:2-hydroxy-3-keto-5-methylthiopentenyl-1-phosphate phosphatase